MYSSFVIMRWGDLRKLCVCSAYGTSIPFLRQSRVVKNSARNFRLWPPQGGRWPSRTSGRARLEPVESPLENVENGGTVQLSRLWKPFVFTVAFSTASFAGAAVWQYENVRARTLAKMKSPFNWAQDRVAHLHKRGHWRQEINAWWSSLTEGERLFAPICFINGLVFLAWRVPVFQATMVKYFCSNPASKALCWPMVLSTFSHYSAFHLFANMYVLHSFSSGAVASLGKEQFLALYLSGGVVSSMASYLYKALTNQPGLSLGASGAIMAILAYVCTQYPDTRLSIIFLPFLTFTAGSAIKAIMAVDAAGVVMGWRFFDHAAHLGGAALGIYWCYWGQTKIWQKREPFLHWWHELRTPTRGK